jgi:hypothetical protein
MPQWRPPTPKDPADAQNRMRQEVRDGVPSGTSYLSTAKQLERLGTAEVRRIAEQMGIARSDSTLRRWRREGRIPIADLATAVKRHDQVQRMGGHAGAAEQMGRSKRTIDRWLADPNHKLLGDAQKRVDGRDLAQSRSRAGVPVNHAGSVTKLPTLSASGPVTVKGDTDSEEYHADRNVDVVLDEATTEAILAAAEAGDYDGARRAAEEYLSTHYAGCAGYGEDYGWHFDDLDGFELKW